MLTYNITISPPEKSRRAVGSDAHKEYIFDKHFKAWCQNPRSPSIGENVKMKGGTGSIIDVITNSHLIEWDGFKPRFLEVFIYETQTTQLFHPSELK